MLLRCKKCNENQEKNVDSSIRCTVCSGFLVFMVFLMNSPKSIAAANPSGKMIKGRTSEVANDRVKE